MTHTRDIDAALRSLDAAQSSVATLDGRARADLQRILASDAAPPKRPEGRRPRLARTTRRAALAGGVLAVLTISVVALPAATRGDQAFATWSPAARRLSTQASTDAAASCRAAHAETVDRAQAGDLRNATPAVADRRGVWTTVVLAGRQGFSALCITDESTHLFNKSMIGSIGTPTASAVPAPRNLVATSLGAGTVNANDVSLAAGMAGKDVAGIAYESRTHGRVEATVSQGHFALWLPGAEFAEASTVGVEVIVVYRDGSTATRRLEL